MSKSNTSTPCRPGPIPHSPVDARIIAYGPCSSGKTTLLYRLKTGAWVQSYPTFSGNHEYFVTADPRARWEVWDVAGRYCNDIACYIHHIATPDTIVLFTIDPSDSLGLNENIEEDLRRVLACEFKFIAVVFTMCDREVRQEDVVALKERVMRVVDLWGRAFGGKNKCSVWDDLGVSARTGKGVDELVRRLLHVARTGSAPERKKVDVPERLTDEELLRRIEEGEKNPVHGLGPEEFLRRMETGELDDWDHMCYLRAGYLCLGECIMGEIPAFAAADIFRDKLDKMLKAKPGKFSIRNHRTLMIFWLCRIFAPMVSYRSAHGVFPTADNFRTFLRESPDLMDDQSWAQYYTKYLLFSREARDAWRLPDLQPLSTLTPLPPKKTATRPPKQPVQKNTNTDLLKRYAYAILKTAKATNQRRAAVIADTFPIIQRQIMRLRAQAVEHVEPYSETHAYFWVQMLHAAVQSVPEGLVPDITRLSFESFSVLFPELLTTDDVWREYYTTEQWSSVEARNRTVLPKRKPLPNVLPAPGKKQLEESMSSVLDEKFLVDVKDKRPSTEELFLQVCWAVKSTSEVPDEAVIPDTHAKLLRRIFDRLVSESPGRESSFVGEAWTAVEHLVSKKRVTEAAFWSQMVINAFRSMDGPFHDEVIHFRATVDTEVRGQEEEDVGNKQRTRTRLFERFLTANPELVWEELWRVYYSDETWNSEDAREMYVLPDKKAVPAYVGHVVDVELEVPSKEEHRE